MPRIAVLIAVAGWLAASAAAQSPEAQPAPASPAIPPAMDTPYPGVISLKVDATDLDHRILAVQERVPVKPGPLTLLYPQWLPGQHGPNGRVDRLAGLMIAANGQSVPWSRNPADRLP